MTITATKWTVCQIGAREHYSISRALVASEIECELITDFWDYGNSLSLIPEKLRQRQHPDVPGQTVTSFNKSFLMNEVLNLAIGRNDWQAIMHRNHWFGEKASAQLRRTDISQGKHFVFSYSYAAREIFETAKSGGALTILGQIDPGPREIELVNQIESSAGAPMTPCPPKAYWDSWRQEVDLADAIVVNSNWSKQLLVESGVDSQKLKVIPLVYENSIANHESVAENRPSASPLKVLFLGQAIARKGVIELIEAIKLLADSGVQWTIVGGGSRELLEELRELPNVVVTGQIARDLAANYYRNHDVFILPTHSDGFAITQLEALDYGLPVIASKMCGDVVEDMKTGLLLDDVSAESIVAAIERLLDQPGLLDDFRDNIGNRKFNSLSDLGQQLVSIFDD